MKLSYETMRLPRALLTDGTLREASREELATLCCLLANGGDRDPAAIAAAIGASEARVKASLAFWDAIEPNEEDNVQKEFAPRLRADEIDTSDARELAREIRDNDLVSLLEECARLLGKPTLNGRDAESITALYTQYGLSEEYIVTLLSDIASRTASGRPTVRRLVNSALRLCADGVETLDALIEHFRIRDSKGEWERTVRRVLGIYDRALSPSERERFSRWTEVYGYAEEIIAKAYDITVTNTSRASTAYMDKLLSAWYAAGVHTLSECERYLEEHRSAGPEKAEPRKKSEKPRYGTFDPAEAFRLALQRSYGDESGENKNEPDHIKEKE